MYKVLNKNIRVVFVFDIFKVILDVFMKKKKRCFVNYNKLCYK